MALSRTVYKQFDFEENCNLEIWVRGHPRSSVISRWDICLWKIL